MPYSFLCAISSLSSVAISYRKIIHPPVRLPCCSPGSPLLRGSAALAKRLADQRGPVPQPTAAYRGQPPNLNPKADRASQVSSRVIFCTQPYSQQGKSHVILSYWYLYLAYKRLRVQPHQLVTAQATWTSACLILCRSRKTVCNGRWDLDIATFFLEAAIWSKSLYTVAITVKLIIPRVFQKR